MEQEIANALIPEVKAVEIGGRKYEIKKLSIKQVLLLSKFLAKYLSSNKDKLNEISKKFGDGSRTMLDDIATLLDILDENQVNELFGILLNEQDIEFIKSNLDLESALDIFAQVLELNSETNVKKNLQKILGLISKKEQEVKN